MLPFRNARFRMRIGSLDFSMFSYVYFVTRVTHFVSSNKVTTKNREIKRKHTENAKNFGFSYGVDYLMSFSVCLRIIYGSFPCRSPCFTFRPIYRKRSNRYSYHDIHRGWRKNVMFYKLGSFRRICLGNQTDNPHGYPRFELHKQIKVNHRKEPHRTDHPITYPFIQSTQPRKHRGHAERTEQTETKVCFRKMKSPMVGLHQARWCSHQQPQHHKQRQIAIYPLAQTPHLSISLYLCV